METAGEKKRGRNPTLSALNADVLCEFPLFKKSLTSEADSKLRDRPIIFLMWL